MGRLTKGGIVDVNGEQLTKGGIFIAHVKPGDELAFTTLKGMALLAAIDAGMIRKEKKGYNVAPFLKFWEIFQPEMKNAVEDTYQVWQSTHKKVGSKGANQCADCSDNHLSDE